MLLIASIVALVVGALLTLGIRWIIHSPKRRDRYRDRDVAIGCYTFLALLAVTFGIIVMGLLLVMNGKPNLALP